MVMTEIAYKSKACSVLPHHSLMQKVNHCHIWQMVKPKPRGAEVTPPVRG